MCVIVERARRRRLARAQQLATAEEDRPVAGDGTGVADTAAVHE